MEKRIGKKKHFYSKAGGREGETKRPQEAPKRTQEAPKRVHKASKRHPRAPKRYPKGTQEHPKVAMRMTTMTK